MKALILCLPLFLTFGACNKPTDAAQHTPTSTTSDVGLEGRVREAVASVPADGKRVTVRVAGGVVTLNGTISSSSARDEVVAAVRAVDGVDSVVDQIIIQP
jgi:osmotically-inducible protein OsmY